MRFSISPRAQYNCSYNSRAAHTQTGIAAADFSRIRNADLGRFTLDRLVSIVNRLGSRVEVQVNFRTLENCA